MHYDATIERLRRDYAGLDDDALRLRYGGELLAAKIEWSTNAANLRLDEIFEICKRHEDRLDRAMAISSEMQRRGIYDPQCDYVGVAQRRWAEEEAARNAERVERISKWLPWRMG